MRSGWVWLGVALTLTCSLGAALAYERATRLTNMADLDAERSSSAGQEFLATFKGTYVDSELSQLDEHRALVVRAAEWRQGMFLALVGVVFFGFASYTLASVIPFARQLREMAEPAVLGAKENPPAS